MFDIIYTAMARKFLFFKAQFLQHFYSTCLCSHWVK